MGQLREKMKEDLKLRRYSPKTRREYLRCARKFAAYHHKSPAEMGEPEVRQFLLYLTEQTKAGPANHKMHVASLKFLYGVTLDRPEVAVRIVWPRVPITLPDVLDRSEVGQLLD